MNKDLVMLDESTDEEKKDDVIVVIANSWKQTDNVIAIPKNEALRLAINIITQVDLL